MKVLLCSYCLHLENVRCIVDAQWLFVFLLCVIHTTPYPQRFLAELDRNFWTVLCERVEQESEGQARVKRRGPSAAHDVEVPL